jgi:hypothetical protein
MKRNLDLWMIGTMSAVTLISTSPQFHMESPEVKPTISTVQHLEAVVPLRALEKLEPLPGPQNVRQMNRSLYALEIRNSALRTTVPHVQLVALTDARHQDAMDRLEERIERASERIERRSKTIADRFEHRYKSHSDRLEYKSKNCADRWEAKMKLLGDRIEEAVNRIALRLEYALLKIEAAISRVHL